MGYIYFSSLKLDHFKVSLRGVQVLSIEVCLMMRYLVIVTDCMSIIVLKQFQINSFFLMIISETDSIGMPVGKPVVCGKL